MDPFERFGRDHAVALGLTVAVAWLAVRTGRAGRADRLIRAGLSVALAAGMLLVILREAARGTLTFTDVLPFHLSDFAVLLAIFALLSLRQRAAELLYFLAAAEVLALITPDVRYGFSHPYTVVFFLLHGGTVVAAAFLTFGKGLQPERGGWLRALLFLNGYALAAALVNAILGTNYLYLRAKPAQPSPLDWMGPWPWYIMTADLLAAALFWGQTCGLRFLHRRWRNRKPQV